jgi:hypothetical protein
MQHANTSIQPERTVGDQINSIRYALWHRLSVLISIVPMATPLCRVARRLARDSRRLACLSKSLLTLLLFNSEQRLSPSHASQMRGHVDGFQHG